MNAPLVFKGHWVLLVCLFGLKKIYNDNKNPNTACDFLIKLPQKLIVVVDDII